jgi:hypothetical protein
MEGTLWGSAKLSVLIHFPLFMMVYTFQVAYFSIEGKAIRLHIVFQTSL